MGTFRGLAAGALVVMVAAGVAAASLTVPTNAAVVDGRAISRTTLNGDLSTISQSRAMQCYLDVQQAESIGTTLPMSGAGVGSGVVAGSTLHYAEPKPATYSSAFVSSWLTQLIDAALFDQANASHGRHLSAYQLARARAAVEATVDGAVQQANGVAGCPTSGASLFSSLPPSFVDQLVEPQAAEYSFVLAAAGQTLTPTTVARYYAAHRSGFDAVCVLYLPASTEAQATSFAAQVAKGTSFATLAQQNQGNEQCDLPAVDPVSKVAAGLRVGQLSSPLQIGQQEFWLVERLSTQPEPLSKVVEQVVQALFVADEPAARTEVAKLQRNSHIWVDPRYGHWVPAPVFTLEPVNAPPADSLVCPSADVPGASAACPPAKPAVSPASPAARGG